MNTSGFYKHSDILLYAPTFVLSPNYELLPDNKDSYEYPVDGWYWFDSEEDAKKFFGIVDEPSEDSINTLT